MDEVADARDDRTLLSVTRCDPEGDGHEETEEDREGDEPVALAIREELCAEGTHGDGGRVVRLDNPATPLK